MDIIIQNSSDRPIYEQIYQQIKQQILSGELKEGDALPSMRLLAKELRISVITTKRAYEELERDGFIVTMVGRGSFVGAVNLEIRKEEQLKSVEAHLNLAITEAKDAGMQKQDLTELLELLYEEGAQ